MPTDRHGADLAEPTPLGDLVGVAQAEAERWWGLGHRTLRLAAGGARVARPGLRAAKRDPLGTLMRLAGEHGGVVDVRLGPLRTFLVNDPDLVRQVLVDEHDAFAKGFGEERLGWVLGDGLLTLSGEAYRRHRRRAQPAFRRVRLDRYGAAVVQEAARAAHRWEDGAQIDVEHEMRQVTLAIVGRTLLGQGLESEIEAFLAAHREVTRFFEANSLVFSGLALRLPLPSTRRFRRARDDLRAAILRLIRARRENGEGDDLLSLLMFGPGRLGLSELRDEALTLAAAGYETTAVALTWTWLLLARHPLLEARMHAELDAVLGGRRPTAGDRVALEYTQMVLLESMRLYPPAWVIDRRAVRDVRIGGRVVPAGSQVTISPYVLHRDPRVFPEPERFDPERFRGEWAARLRSSYMPFGAGPRQCIGRTFALMEGVLVLAAIAQGWRLRGAPGAAVIPRPRLNLRPHGPLLITLERRQLHRPPEHHHEGSSS